MSEHPVTPTKVEMGKKKSTVSPLQPMLGLNRITMFMFTQNADSQVKPFPWNVTLSTTFTYKSEIQNVIRQ